MNSLGLRPNDSWNLENEVLEPPQPEIGSHIGLFLLPPEDSELLVRSGGSSQQVSDMYNMPFGETWSHSTQTVPPDSLLFNSSQLSQPYDDSFDFQPSPLAPFHAGDFPPEGQSSAIQSPPQLPRIYVDFPVSEMSAPIQVPRRHGEYTPTSSGYASHSSMGQSSPSSGCSLPTPSMSPVTGFHAFVNYSPVSPGSPFIGGPLDHQMLPNVGYSMEEPMMTAPEIADRFASPHDGPLVPQKTYRPHTQSDRKRYVEEVKLEEPIMFFMSDHNTCGISLCDALTGKFMRLVGRDDPMFVNRGPSVSIRLMWPGYAPWSRQIPTRDFRTPPQPITRSKLAKNVAKTVQRFIDEMQQQRMEDDADPRWRVGNNHICLEHLFLVGLQHVSMGSWQAYVRLQRPTLIPFHG